MNRSKFATLAAAAAAAFLIASPVRAAVWNENNAGDLPGSAEITSAIGSLDEIRGTLTSTIAQITNEVTYQIDLYKIYINSPISFSASTVSSAPFVDDTALFLFDSAGKGVYTNDDNGINFLSTLAAGGVTSAGFYYLGVSVGSYEARDASFQNIFASGSIADPAAGPLASWAKGLNKDEGSMAYDIVLTGAVAAVPEPTTALLMLLGLAGVAAARKTRRGAAV